MANIERRPNGGWRARYYDHAGKQHVKHSPRKIDAKAWIDALTASVLSEASTVVCTSGLSCTAIIDIHLWRPDRMPIRTWDRRAWSEARPDKVVPTDGTVLTDRWIDELHRLGFRSPLARRRCTQRARALWTVTRRSTQSCRGSGRSDPHGTPPTSAAKSSCSSRARG